MKTNSKQITCPRCDGVGEIKEVVKKKLTNATCYKCNGTGKVKVKEETVKL